MTEILVWCLTAVLMLVGFAGVILPILPGTTLILGAAVLHKVFLPADISWWVLGFVAMFWLLSVIADFGGAILGTRLFGGTKWGMAGATGGALVGMFFSIPALLLGTVLGAIVAEKLFAKGTDTVALKSGFGAATGFVLSTVARLFCAGAMIGLFLVSAVAHRAA